MDSETPTPKKTDWWFILGMVLAPILLCTGLLFVVAKLAAKGEGAKYGKRGGGMRR